ncbi:hypothetical protein EDD76_11943 [Kineothrix alysoides]|uniref:DUF402 domain-containing protein n=1 Tax=Kineothrix alysoides TaxID=1469948 RepID=A0A4R1QWC7_9FIRM|nr:hypothetical protein [Kineothrix alysoides]TCL54620.1 hypothetical protein EDD76_11943 [Kineothrix alysoides]
MKNKILYLSNIEIFEYCTLDRVKGTAKYQKDERPNKIDGLYFKQNELFFALYWENNSPIIYFDRQEYPLKKTLDIELIKDGKNRKFIIKDYNIYIEYKQSIYIDMDVWSNELDVDLFCKLMESYKTDEFYDNKPQKLFKFPWTKG